MFPSSWYQHYSNADTRQGHDKKRNLHVWASIVAQLVKNPPAMWETWVPSLVWEDPLEKGMATHSSILTWRIRWTVQSMGSQRVERYWVTFTFTSFSQWGLRHREQTYEHGVGGGRFQMEGTYVHLWLIHVDVWQKPTQHCKAITLQLKMHNKKLLSG